MRGLERYEDAPVEEVRGATRRAFENLVELAIDEEVAFVLLAGDIYDGDWRDYNTGLFFVKQMNRLREAGIPVHLVAGNHDAASQVSKHLRLPDNVTHYAHKRPETKVIADFDLAIHGQSFANRSENEDLAAGYPHADPALFNIGLLHTSLDGRPPHGNYAPCTADTLRSKGYRYWALGHVHRREEVCVDPWIVFPGNTQGRHARETGPKGCTLVTVEHAEVRSAEHRSLDTLRWEVVRVDVTGAVSAEATLDAVRDALEAAADQADGRLLAARLVLEGAAKAHAELASAPEHWHSQYRAVASSLGDSRVWLEKVQLRTRRAVDIASQMTRDDALGDLFRMVADLESAPLRLETLAEEFASLKRKLPPELFGDDEPLDPTDPEVLKAALPDVKEMLLSRLGEEGGHS